MLHTPTTRYQGSKRKNIDWIYSVIKDLEFSSALDLFGGTGSISYLFKKMGKSVIYNDFLKFNYLIGKALIENDSVLITEEDVSKLNNTNSNIRYHNIVQMNFKDIYFLEEENMWIDKIMSNLIELPNLLNYECEYKESLAYYSLFQSCMIKRPFNLFHRKNLNLRLNNVERSFGNKATWDKPFEEHFQAFCTEINNYVFKGKSSCYSTNYSFHEIDHYDYDLVYIDPPYLNTGDGKNESSNYFKCYHFLEGLTHYSEWENMIDFSTKNHRLQDKFGPNYFKKSIANKTFEDLISKFRDKKIVLSYKNGGVPSLEEIDSLLNKYKKEVKVFTRKYYYALNKQNGDAEKNREVLFVAQ